MAIMLPIKNRLKKKKDFERTFKRGQGVKGGFMFLKFVGNNLKASRFGFVVGRKVSKKAVVRNKIKRRLKEAARRELGNIKPGFDGIWVALPGLELEGFETIQKTAKKILQKAKLI